MNHKLLTAAPIDNETPNKKESLLGFLLGLGYLTIFAIIPVILLQIFFPGLEETVLTTLAQLITIFVVVVLMFYISRRTVPAIRKGFSMETIKTGVIYAALMYGASLLWGIIDLLIFGDSVTNANQAALFNLANVSPVLFFTLVVIGAPLIEELIFRYYLYKGLEPRSPLYAMIISTVAFALIHLLPSLTTGTFLEDLRTLPNYLIPSFLFAIAYYRTKHLTVTITAHIVYNLVTVVLLFIQMSTLS